tara:strand:- start:6657 stop:10160 length:3504 start_codon:yes stop_codon:yes gene_type:complete
VAVVGHAYVVVRAITDSVANDIARGFDGNKINQSAERSGKKIGSALTRGLRGALGDKNNALTRLAHDFQQLYPEAEGLRRAFTNAMRAGYTLQSALGALVGGISAAIGGLAGLAGAAGGAAASLVSVASAMVTLKVGLGIAKFALGGISAALKESASATGDYREEVQQLRFAQEEAALSEDRAAFNLEKARKNLLRTQDLAPNSMIRRDATLAFKEAELAYRKAKDGADDLKDGLDKPLGGSDPFADLTPSQVTFAKYLISIKGILKDLKEAAASGFLPILQTQMQRIIDSPLLGILETRFHDIGVGAGLAVKNFVDVLLEPENVRDFNEALGDMAEVLPKFGSVLGNVFDAFLSAIVAADPLTRRFVDWLEGKTGAFADFLDLKQATGELEAFFDRSGDIAAEFGRFFGGLFGGFGNLIESNFGPGSGGDRLLVWLADAAQGFANKDMVGLDIYFQGVADNTIAMGEALGGALDTMIRLGSHPAIAQFWEALDAGSYAFDHLVRGFIESQVEFGKALATITEILAVFADSGQPLAFFETLDFVLGGIRETVKALEPIINVVGPAFAVASALALMHVVMSKGIMIVASYITSTLGSIGALFGKATATAAVTTAETLAIGTTITLTATEGGLVIATNAATAAQAGLATGIKAVSATIMGVPIIGWIIAAAAAVATLVTVVAGIHGAKMDKAVEGVTAGFNNGASASDIFRTSLEALGGSSMAGHIMDDVDGIKGKFEDLARSQSSFLWATQSKLPTTQFADALGAVGRALANMAVTDLSTAQKQFSEFTGGLNLNRKEMQSSLDEMDEYKKALVDQADQLGINVKGLDGNVVEHLLLDFALGEGEIAVRRHKVELEKQAEALVAVAAASIETQRELSAASLAAVGFGDSVSTSFKDIETDDIPGLKSALTAAMTDMSGELTANSKFNQTLVELQVKGVGEAGMQMIRDAGASGPALAAALNEAAQPEFDKFVAMADKAALQTSDKFSKAKADLVNAWVDGEITGAAYTALSGGLNAASSPEELNRIAGVIAKELAGPYTAKVGADISGAKTTLSNWLKNSTQFFEVKALMRKDGGYIEAYAGGGFVSGPGTARSDSVPAMLSNGEYVVNARATAANRGILEAINANKEVSAGGGKISIVVNPSPGMDEKELAAAVSRQLAFQIRKGTI